MAGKGKRKPKPTTTQTQCGCSCLPVMWNKHIDALAEKFKVYAIDLWGFGYSERIEPPAYSFELYGKQVAGFMDALSRL